jgi:hypothetical protein
MKNTEFLNKHCKLTYQTGFVIDGIVTDIDAIGITFKTERQTAFISWSSIRDIKLSEREA